jgi:alkanesulfonate monooxygenase SsuD/methylene tetrahydromethanopterin reductase-like flavin-dependent oxidoreductase (luciferase family)
MTVAVHAVLGPAGDLGSLRDRVARLDDAGVAGVLVPDHLFFALGGERASSYKPDDPFVVLATVAALSPRLSVGTLVANVGIVHPALVLRHFAQLAALVGGDRVLAGIGAGWNTEEFDGLGIDMPSHGARLERLEEACRLARAWFDDGIADVDGAHVTARSLPMAPATAIPPRLLLGGGSDRFLDLAGRYADVVDLNGSSRRRPLGRAMPVRDDRARRRSTTFDDLTDAAARVQSAATAAGRPTPAFSIVLEVDGEPSDCPYVLGGDAAAQRDQLTERVQRLGLTMVAAPEAAAATLAS